MKRLKWEGYMAAEKMLIKKEESELRCSVSLHESHITAYRIRFKSAKRTPLVRKCPVLILAVTQNQALGSVKCGIFLKADRLIPPED